MWVEKSVRVAWSVGLECGGVWWGKPGDRAKSLLYIDVKLSPCKLFREVHILSRLNAKMR